MAALVLHLTNAGLAAVQGVAGSDKAVISHVGLTASAFDPAPTLTALPGEFKRLPVAAGIAAAPNVVHLTAYDRTADVWSARGLGLYLEDGTLFAVHASADVVLSKAARAFALIATDITFGSDLAANITFGDVDFTWPPATEETRGIATIARLTRVLAATDAEDDAWTIVTPKTLRSRLATLMSGVNATFAAINDGMVALSTSVGTSLATFAARRIEGGGLVSGGGDLGADRTLSVTEATAAETAEGMSTSTVITPRRLGPIAMRLQQNGFVRVFGLQIAWGRFSASANSSTVVSFAEPFPSECFSVVASGVIAGGTDSQDNPPAVVGSSINQDSFSVFSADDTATLTCYIAVGR